jgi:hypothetical protein
VAIAYAFTFTAFLAVVLHSWYMSRVFRRRIEVRASSEPEYVQAVARALQNMEVVRWLINLSMLVAGLGITTGGPFRAAGYLLAVVPVLSMIASTIALRGL